MACSGRFAEAWQFAAMFCQDQILTGADNSGAVGNAFLTDTFQNFVGSGLKAGVGMWLWNLTDGSDGPIMGFTNTTITATLSGGVLNNWSNGNQYRVSMLTNPARAMIETMLDIAVGDIHKEMESVEACDCSKSAAILNYLAKLNIIDAAVLYNCSCGGSEMDGEERNNWLVWLERQYELIRNGSIELCQGHTGSTYPAAATAELGTTVWNRARIIGNRIRRGI